MYFVITKEIETELDKNEEILVFTKGNGLGIAVDSNSRSVAWHDSQTNQKGKIMEEYIISKNLNIINEESEQTTFQNRRSSNIDLTIVNNQLLTTLKNWEIREEESCSDHNIIKFGLGQDIYHDTVYDYNGHRYVVTDENLKQFDINLSRIVATMFSTVLEDSAYLDRDLALQVKKLDNIESAVDLFQEALILTCKKSFKIRRATKKTTKHKSVPWWTVELTLMRKSINALRRRYQRTKNNEDLRRVAKISTTKKRQNIKQQ